MDSCGLRADDLGIVALLDMSLSLVVDTVALPYTFYKQKKYGNICHDGVLLGSLPRLSVLTLTQVDKLSVWIYESGHIVKEYSAVGDDQRRKKLVQWANKNDRGWVRSPAIYPESGIFVSSRVLSIDFFGTTAILNEPEGQFQKAVNPADYEFLR